MNETAAVKATSVQATGLRIRAGALTLLDRVDLTINSGEVVLLEHAAEVVAHPGDAPIALNQRNGTVE